jgi:hypothetical protein
LPARKLLHVSACFLATALCGCAAPIIAGEPSMNTLNETLPSASAPTRDGTHDFDFLFGKWDMQNRRLAKRLANSHEWIEYPSTAECQPMPGGIGNQDVVRTDFYPNFVGLTFRIYDPKTRLWALYWIDNRNDYHGKLEAPVIGSFHGSVGVFEGPDDFNGKPIVVRYTWTVLDHDHLHWEQAFSLDGGKTWETNFTNDLERVSG